jgi:nicotinate phosphoribosyltransferase
VGNLEEYAPFPLLPQILSGETADVYFLRARRILSELQLDPQVGMEIFPSDDGICCGTREVEQLLAAAGFNGEMWTLGDGEPCAKDEAVVELFCPYSSIGIYETAILGILSSCTGWATAARSVVDAAGEVPIVSFGARHVHPNVSAQMDYAAVIGGCITCSTTLGAALAGTEPSGTMPHALILVMGDTVEAAQAFDRIMPDDVTRVVLVDTFQDEVIESARVAGALGDHLTGVRLDTPSQRGGVTPDLVKEVRARLDQSGYDHVKIYVSGGMTPERIRTFHEASAPVNSYGVGSYISTAPPITFTADIREIEGTPVAKRGRLPGMQRNPSLQRAL